MERFKTAREGHRAVRLYTSGWVAFATALGGPLAGAYMMSKNFKSFGEIAYAENALRIGVAATMLLFGTLLFLPESFLAQIPDEAFSFLQGGVVFCLMDKYQDKRIKEHLQNKGPRYSGWRATGIGILSVMITFLFMLIVAICLPESMLE